MSYLTQKTVKKNVTFSGIALHSGFNVNVNIKPADPNFGIVFKRIDLKNNNLVYPNFANVTNTSLNTTIENEFASYGFDDTGNKATKEFIIKEGILQRGLGGLESQERAEVKGVANVRACSWNRAPIDRMANLNLEPGDATFDDIKLAIETCRKVGNNDITILKCTSSYPAPIDEANLVMMKEFAIDFNVKIGLSDHTLSNLVPIMSIAYGAKVIEKHFKLNDDVGGADASFSLNETQFKSLVDDIRSAESAIGLKSYNLSKKQISGKRFGRSIYISKNIKSGEKLSRENLKIVRPSLSLHPKYFYDILGKKVVKDFKKGSRISLDDIV